MISKIHKNYQILRVDFPFSEGGMGSKARPALAISDSVGEFGEVVLIFMTSKKPKKVLETDICIEKESDDFVETG